MGQPSRCDLTEEDTLAGERVSVALLAGFLFGCAHHPIRPVSANVATERVFQRNYELGKPQSVYVGEAVVKFKDYSVRKSKGKHMRPTSSFRAKTLLRPWMPVQADVDCLVRGELDLDGVRYRAVEIWTDGQGFWAVLVAPDGSVYPKRLVNGSVRGNQGGLFPDPASLEPVAVTFVAGADETVVDTTAGFTNFELIYGGTDGRSFTLTYREYSPQDLIRPAFTQNLTYANGSTAVRFRSTRLAIQEVTAEKITYSVIADESEAKK